MGRHNNFIQAFTEYHKDDYVPDKFYMWSAINLVAGALERKVWVPIKPGLNMYPNMYIFLVARPAIGKSSAIKPAVKMVLNLNEKKYSELRLLPNKVTEPKLLDLMDHQEYFTYKNNQFPHTSVLFYASEGSACFNDPYGGLAQTITALYDGDDITKATVSRKELVKIINPYVNVLAGCTFDYLSRLLTTEGILGGFASRITYVVQDEIIQRKSLWQTDDNNKGNGINYDHMLDDLHEIYQMVGPFKADDEFAELYEEWFPQFDLAQQKSGNEKLQSLMSRKFTAMRKLPMIMSAAESSDRILRKRHWVSALKLMDTVEKHLPGMIREGQAHNVGTQIGVNNAIFKVLMEGRGVLSPKILVAQVTLLGHTPDSVQKTLASLLAAGDALYSNSAGLVTMIGDPNLYI